jgi:hypothetical protein
MEDQLENLKEQLLTPLLASVENVALIHELRGVANEAAGLAWCTVCPLLVLPALLEEKVRAALQRRERQELLKKRNAPAKAPQELTTSFVHHFAPAVMAAA